MGPDSIAAYSQVYIMDRVSVRATGSATVGTTLGKWVLCGGGMGQVTGSAYRHIDLWSCSVRVSVSAKVATTLSGIR